jgi:hypothetical protein
VISRFIEYSQSQKSFKPAYMGFADSTPAGFRQKSRLEKTDYKTLANESASNLGFPSRLPSLTPE